MEFQNKNDYSVIVFCENDKTVKVSYVHSCYSLAKWLDNSKYKDWKYFNVYVRRSGRFLKRFYKGNYIENKPK